MSTYLLLRNNKQAGPYTLDDLKTMSLKAYDLVWVEGKSAAWRYPGEIEELKSFAPPVEEQPFDRFFKKPVQEEQVNKQPAVEVEKSRYAPVASEQATPAPNKAAVYINLPADSKSTEEKPAAEYVEARQPVRERVVPREPVVNKEPAPVQKRFAQSIPAGSKIQAIGNEDFSSTSDELNKLYAQRDARLKKKQGPDLRHLLKPIGIGVGLVALLVAGIFIGLSISGRGSNSTQKNFSKEQAGVSEQQSTIATKTIPAKNLIPAQQNDKNSQILTPVEDPSTNVPDEKALEERRKARAAKKRIADSLNALKAAPVKIDSSAFIADRESTKKATETKNEKESIKNNIEDYVSLSGSKFNVGTFGGISDLQLTVSNTSPFALDLVVVEVQYIQSNKKIFKTENLYYHNITAGAAIMQEAPKSSRGVKVKYRITIISAKNLGISYTEL
ncbi:MAG: DUF4339 domain-containing protein [Bacteroidetes bacterium]|nr:DUF4339 domain-containing protein [Bacteroidota bacterium]